MGKGTDKLYITHSEWASGDAYSASAGSGLAASKTPDTTFKRLPFNFCAVSLQPFSSPVCTSEGTIFDIDNILSWLQKNGTNPVTGNPLSVAELIKLKFIRNDEGQYVDPVTFKTFTDNTHIVALKNTGNVFAYDTVERLNIKAKMWRDLVNDEEFGRKDIITLQDPQNIQSRNLSSFKYLQDGVSTLTEKEKKERGATVNRAALGNGASVLKSKESESKPPMPKVGKYLHSNQSQSSQTPSPASAIKLAVPPTKPSTSQPSARTTTKTTGLTAASFTSTGLTPHTATDLALLTEEEYILRPRQIKSPGYARLLTSHGPLTLELYPEHAPRAVWNFLKLAEKGYYDGTIFHRNIRSFMLQGGDPTGTGRGGQSVWGKNFKDELEGPLKHSERGMVSMANKGKDTNSSQFFITYRACPHLDRKHTVFGRVIQGEDDAGANTLAALESVPVDGTSKKPLEDIALQEATVLVDPFVEFLARKSEKENADRVREEIRRAGGSEGEKVTWTGKRVRGADSEDGGGKGSVGQYLPASGGAQEEVVVEEWEQAPERKKAKAGKGGFGNFDGW